MPCASAQQNMKLRPAAICQAHIDCCLAHRHALLFRDRFNWTGIHADVTPELLEQIGSTPGALSQVRPALP